MVFQFTVYPLARLVRYIVSGVPTNTQVEAFLTDVLADPRFEPGFDFLGECPDTNEPTAVYPPALAHAVRNRAGEFSPCRWAVVVSTVDGETLVRRWAKLLPANGIEVASFSNHSAAVDWLTDA